MLSHPEVAPSTRFWRVWAFHLALSRTLRSCRSTSVSICWLSGPGMGSHLVLVARRAITAAATKKMLEASNARWNPEVSASGKGTWWATKVFVRDVAMAEKTAKPRAAPPASHVALR